MPKLETDMEYNTRTLQSIIKDQAVRYFKFTTNHKEIEFNKETAELACKVSYTLNIAAGIQKSFKQEKRITAIEEKLKANLVIPMGIFEEAPLKEYR